MGTCAGKDERPPAGDLVDPVRRRLTVLEGGESSVAAAPEPPPSTLSLLKDGKRKLAICVTKPVVVACLNGRFLGHLSEQGECRCTMGKKKGLAKARARNARNRSAKSPSPSNAAADGTTGPIVPLDGQRVRRGLQNLGNTCFMNSIVQCLNVSLPFSDDLLELFSQGLEGIPRSLGVVFRGIRGVEAVSGSKTSYNPKPLREELVKTFPWYEGKQQQDAHELLRTLLGNISDEVTKAERAQRNGDVPAGEETGSCGRCVFRSFRGHICAATLCWGCGRVSLRLDPFLDLSLDLPALVGQRAGALGVTDAMISGAPPSPQQPAEAAAEEGDRSEGERAGSRAERKERRRRGKDGGNAPAKAEVAVPKPKAGPRGVWATRSAAETIRDGSRQLVARLIVRAIQKELALGDEEGHKEDEKTEAEEKRDEEKEEAEEAEEAAVTTEIQLKRQKKLDPSWGFKWSESHLEDGCFLLASVKEDSVLDKWNMKRRATGEAELVVCVGDRLLEVNGVSGTTEMRKVLKQEEKVTLKFARGKASTGKSLAGARDDTDQEAERKAEERESLRKEFCDLAGRCHADLPEVLHEVFGPEKANKTPNGHLQLEDCLSRFSAVEALEDEFKPVYDCSQCSGKSRTKMYASRRMWLWQADLPPLLTLQLKRFRRYGQRFEKSVTSIKLPTVLDLGNFVLSEQELRSMQPFLASGEHLLSRLAQPENVEAEDADAVAAAATGAAVDAAALQQHRYELYGICVHQGSTMASGHYVAYVNSGPSLEKEAWFGISDTQVWSCPRAEVFKAEAYIAFYRREGSGEVFTAARAPEATVEKTAKSDQVDDDEEGEADEEETGEADGE